VKPRESIESRAPRGTSALSELSESDEANAFASPWRRFGSIKPVTRLACSAVAFFVGVKVAGAVRSELLAFAAVWVGMFGVTWASVGALDQLRRRVRSERRKGDHSLAVLLLMLLAGIVCSLAFVLWVVLLFFGNPAD